jgi:plastocyanin
MKHAMKKILLFSLSLIALRSFATIWEVEAGGGGNLGTPYFDPQFITIQQGDVVHWTWVSGQHNVAATSGPESFNSGSHFSPFNWSFTFDLPGEYDYECSLFEHADSQFGTITVTPLSVAEVVAVPALDFSMAPNPANTHVVLEKSHATNTDIVLTSITGQVILSERNVADTRRQLDVSFLAPGIYFVVMTADGNTVRKRLLVK